MWLDWAARIGAALIMVQTLFFKFTGAEESVYIFRTLGAEPWGRVATGVFELIASVLLLITPLAAAGAALSASLMAGAIGAHLFVLGVEVKGDGGYLFFLAMVTLGCSLVILFIRRAELIALLQKYAPTKLL